MWESTLDAALAEGRTVLFEHEVLSMLDALGRPVPRLLFWPASGPPPAGREPWREGPCVLKAVGPGLLHKTDAGALRFLPGGSRDILARAAEDLSAGLAPDAARTLAGFCVQERVPFQPGPGRELMAGLRGDPAFGTVQVAGFGGTAVETLARALAPSDAAALRRPGLTPEARWRGKLDASLFGRLVAGRVRGSQALQEPAELAAELEGWFEALEAIRRAVEARGRAVGELELNPLVWSGRWVAVDALLRTVDAPPAPPVLPEGAVGAAVRPRTVAVLGASSRRRNAGRVVLGSLLAAGFPRERLWVVRPDGAPVDGVRAVRSIEDLPEPVDQLIVTVPAAGVPGVVASCASSGRARSVLLMSGGLGETENGRELEARALSALSAADPASRPVLVGSNSLGLVSRPARVDSLFVPAEKVPRAAGGPDNVAVVSQSGAFLITLWNRLEHLTPRYLLSAGNQMDVRLSHLLEAAAEDEAVTTFALYTEGLKPGDGEALCRTVRRLAARGRDCLVYKGGRSALGKAATRGHTASVAGDHRVFRELFEDAGAAVADRFETFHHLIRLSSALCGKTFGGPRVAFLSNAGFEAVGMADRLEGPGWRLEPARLSDATRERIAALLAGAGIEGLVNVGNPLDLTPMADDGVHLGCLEALLDDPCVDLVVAGHVPMSPCCRTLPRGIQDGDVFDDPQGYASLVPRLFERSAKPFVVAVDAGGYYAPFVRRLVRGGVPVLPFADTAVEMLGRYARARLARS